MIQITKMAGASSRQNGGIIHRKSNPLSFWIKRMAMVMIMALTSSTIQAISPLSFSGSIPENEGQVSSFNDIQIQFDFSEIESEYGTTDGWGVSREGAYNSKPARCTGAILYKGDVADGEILSQLTNSITMDDDGWVEGNAIHLSFPGVEVIPGQKYSVYVNYIVYANRRDDPASYGYINLRNSPVTIVLYGSNNVSKQLSVKGSSINTSTETKSLESVSIEFNSEIELNNSYNAKILEGSETIAESSSFSVDGSILTINFDTIPLFITHNYTLILNGNSVYMKDEPSILNSELSFNFEGSTYHEFGYKRITPRPSQPSLIEEIQVTFDFPEGCGFVNMEDAGITGYPMKVYKGEEANEENYLTTINGETTDGGALLFKPKYDFDAETKYTFVIEEGVVKPWIIGAARGKTLPDYKCNPVTVTYTTPAAADIPKVVITPQGSELPELGSLEDGIRIPVEQYVFDETDYAFSSCGKKIYGDDILPSYHPLYEIGDEEDLLLGYYFFYPRNTSDNGCYLELSIIGQKNLPVLLEGKEYEFRFPEGAYVAEQNLLKKYSGNEAFNYRFKGTTSPINDFGLKANIDDRLHSHADVFSFVTESEVKAGENAKMILKDGEENIAEAPVYVSREANGHRVYADFGGKKLESGKSYDVVLPEGSVYATNGIVNNPEIKSSITAMPETLAAPEFISVALNIDEYASATYRMVKGEESVVNLKAGEDWKLESLKLNGDDVTADVAENGLYTLPALDADATLDASYAYAHPVDYDYTTGVGNIEDCPYTLSKNAEHLVISNLKGGESIEAYTLGGMKIADLPAVPADMHEASIALPEGQVYIVMINGTAIKWQH